MIIITIIITIGKNPKKDRIKTQILSQSEQESHSGLILNTDKTRAYENGINTIVRNRIVP